ncbi:MAG: hypothetical protein D6680_10035 [Cyanobacteria bacterium J007]|nr:MAG: hypothetical protein D6680_10035 [Cyanobacteria bacterium J007]
MRTRISQERRKREIFLPAHQQPQQAHEAVLPIDLFHRFREAHQQRQQPHEAVLPIDLFHRFREAHQQLQQAPKIELFQGQQDLDLVSLRQEHKKPLRIVRRLHRGRITMLSTTRMQLGKIRLLEIHHQIR